MADTDAGRRLTEAHRLAQLRLGRAVATQVRAVWPMLDPAALDRLVAAWLAVVETIIASGRVASAQLARTYLDAFAEAEGIAVATPQLASVGSSEAVRTSMAVTGPVAVKTAVRAGVPLPRALQLGADRSARAAMRHVSAGGRDTITGAARSDPRILGWARATSGDPCSFCAMLASRGPVYRRETVGFRAHDGCTCVPEPVLRRDPTWPPGAREYQKLWQRSTRGLSNENARAAFRRAIEGRPLPGDPVAAT